MAAKESKKRKRDSPQSSSGAPEPAPDPFLNPPSKSHPLGDHNLSELRKRITQLAKQITCKDLKAASDSPRRTNDLPMGQLQWACDEEEEEAQRVDQLSVLATRIQIRAWWARGGMTRVREEIHKWRLQENHERKLWRIYKALCAEKEHLPLGSNAQRLWLDAIRGRRGGKS